ncbi:MULTISPECIES: hypothetical protein [Methylosinus]|uniref:Uncharacterized protein n=1 Tax=Methylosinus trichosporium (strain ATCC 35070 / NCIMB 11131 / UNIQEM 75 / OB3b) TaxID=595536 RepID=A0A2D2D3Z2_METT3|nr:MULTISPECIES: hypothetical protein [Methylosinus]ATQ69684.1 hypothetical protein CQW49_18705 [Methylosinus trichosporium OB3b]OBS51228.1 hypothetical protein A8B73_17390 [Methylosinus sp. 3S-1]
MDDFATILTRLEETPRSDERKSDPSLASLLEVFARLDTATPKSSDKERASLASRVYGASSEPPAPRADAERSQPLPDREAFFAELRRAEGSLHELRALRRRIAWLCHPDRREKSGARQAERLLAEFNAQIDAAVARAPWQKLRHGGASRR